MSDIVKRIYEEPAKLDPLTFSPEMSALIEALSEDDDDRVVPFRTLQGQAEQVREVQDDVDPAANEVEDEDEQTSSAADWSTVSTKQARQFIRNCPDAKIEILFPAVFEEDRSKKIADLDAAHSAKAIPHRTMAEQMAKELGIENYDYDTAQAQIAEEQPSLGPGRLGAGDDLGDRAQGDARRGPTDDLDRNSLRDDRPPGEELANLRQDERAAMEVSRSMRVPEGTPLTINVVVPPQPPRTLEMKRDKQGLITKVVEMREKPIEGTES